jgi:hypothetical protein
VETEQKSFVYDGVEYIEEHGDGCVGCEFFADNKACFGTRSIVMKTYGEMCGTRNVIYVKKTTHAPVTFKDCKVIDTDSRHRAEIAAKQAIIDQLTAKLDTIRGALEN